MKTRSLTMTALLAALLCVCAPWALPVGPVPVTLASFAVYLAAALAGWKRGTLAVAVYLLLGCIGLPVFSGFRGGVQVLAGPTGGFLIGYLPCAVLTGFVIGRDTTKLWRFPTGMALGTLACYALGTAWFIVQTRTAPAAALTVCVLPFLPGDAVKIVAATLLGRSVRRALEKSDKG